MTAANTGGVRRSGARAQDHVCDGGQSARLGARQLPHARLVRSRATVTVTVLAVGDTTTVTVTGRVQVRGRVKARLALQLDKLEGAVGLNEGLLPRAAVSPVSAWFGLGLGLRVGLG